MAVTLAGETFLMSFTEGFKENTPGEIDVDLGKVLKWSLQTISTINSSDA